LVLQDEYSLTDQYFSKMGLKFVFMPQNSVAMAFLSFGDLLADYTGLISSISRWRLSEDLSPDLQRKFSSWKNI
jgi:hypothetical protein